jgi:hypothetical protein
MTKKYWTGETPTHCDLTGIEIKNCFVDGRVAGKSGWAFMSPEGHAAYGVGLGTGLGQKYQRQPDGRWLKVEG